MFPVYGLAEASLAVSFPPVGRTYQAVYLDRHQLGVGDSAKQLAAPTDGGLGLVSVGRAIPYCELRIAGNDDAPLPHGKVGHIHIRGGNVTTGYYEDAQTNAATFTTDGWLKTGDLGLVLDGETYITGRAKEILFVNGQNYYPHDLEAIAQRADGLELGKVVVAGVRLPNAQTDDLLVFVLHRGELVEFLATAAQVTRLVNEHTGLEVSDVVPVKRIPKTTSGKVQRHLLEESYVNGEFKAELEELHRLQQTHHKTQAGQDQAANDLERHLKGICDAALPGKDIAVHDNLFEIGASSLKLIEIHEQIDRDFPGQLDLTELFDHPTIAELAKHLQGKQAG